ncbi:hypothetical protein D3C71_1427450 [compost metagenome]
MPPWAVSNRPSRRLAAPVKAPRSWPNSSDCTRAAGIAPQFTARNGCACRGDSACRACAASSLPVPVSPVISTGRSTGANLRIAARATCSTALSPISCWGPCAAVARASPARACRRCTIRPRSTGAVQVSTQAASSGCSAGRAIGAPAGRIASRVMCRCSSSRAWSRARLAGSAVRRSSRPTTWSLPRMPMATHSSVATPRTCQPAAARAVRSAAWGCPNQITHRAGKSGTAAMRHLVDNDHGRNL